MERADPQVSVLRLGVFELNLSTGELRKGGMRIRLQPQPFKVLALLLERPGELVTREEIQRELWRDDTFVDFEHALNFAVKKLRQALDDDADHPRYIETLPKRGYRFIGPVERAPRPAAHNAAPPSRPATHPARVISITQASALADDSARAERAGHRGLAEVAPDSEVLPAPAPRVASVPEPVPAVQSMRPVRWIGIAVAVAAILAAFVFRPTVPAPKISRIRQLTHLGTLVNNTKLVSDGPRVYFRVWQGHERALRYVSPAGGEVFAAEMPFPQMDIDDISRDGSEFLVVELSAAIHYPLWRVPVPSGSPQPVGNVRANDARWSPDGRSMVYADGSDLYFANSDGSNSKKLGSLPGQPIYLPWSPDGKRLRFSVEDPGGGGVALWQADLPSNTVRPLLPDWNLSRRVLPGGWTPDDRYFFFTALEGGTNNVWALREEEGILRRVNSRPVQLTTGPLNFYQPTPSKDGKSIFVVGEQPRGQLVRYDAPSRQFVPYAGGISADQVAFSRDARWMAYIEFPEGVLVRSRVDGSNRRQLTFPPMRAYSPQWSPDGTQLAVQASAGPGAPNKIYLVPRDGGVPVLAARDRRDQQSYPSWSAQGKSLVFTSYDESGANPALYTVDVKKNQVALLPGTAGLFWGQISPDGRHIAALADAAQKLMIYDTVAHTARSVAPVADYLRWSADGTYVYFRTPYYHGGVENPGVYRWIAGTKTIEKVAADPDFRLNGVYGVWSGLTPDGALLVVRNLSTSDLYSLDVDLP